MKGYNVVWVFNPERDRVLMCLRRKDPYKGLYNLVGGKIEPGESSPDAAWRELREETGLLPEHVEILGATPGWLRYRLPHRAVRHQEKHVCIGQKQVWFLLRLVGDESHVRLDLTESPEFDHWRWVDFWYPMQHVVMFKRGVYARALCHLAPFAQLVAGTQAVPPMLMEAWMPHMGMGRPPPRRPAAKRGGDRSAK